MDRTASTSHAGHDELLIARLYGGDVDARDRALALDLLADCEDCAALFADLGTIAQAAATLEIPPRPRDFSLTEVDAARLRTRPRRRLALLGLGLRQSLGGALAALGLIGVVATGASSLLGMTATSAQTLTAAAAPAATSAPADLSGVSNFGAEGAGVPTFATTPAPVPVAAASEAPAPTAAPTFTLPEFTATSPAPGGTPAGPPSQASSQTQKQTGAGTPSLEPAQGGAGTDHAGGTAATAGQTGIDLRLLSLAAFLVLFVVGLAIALLPQRLRGRHHAA